MASSLAPEAPPAELWRHPNPKATQMFSFLEHVNSKHGLKLIGYPELYKWSVDDIASFWEDIWNFVGIKASRPYNEVRYRLPLARYKMNGHSYPCWHVSTTVLSFQDPPFRRFHPTMAATFLTEC